MKRNLGNQYADALARVERMESRLNRAYNAWRKAKDEAKRLGKRMDKLQGLLTSSEAT